MAKSDYSDVELRVNRTKNMSLQSLIEQHPSLQKYIPEILALEPGNSMYIQDPESTHSMEVYKRDPYRRRGQLLRLP